MCINGVFSSSRNILVENSRTDTNERALHANA